ncbi:hypothetical protein CSC94_00810 [Zhengella mangrovi]|uniref:Uncharacterized protein n=1 Tax=Zhengella mangrovi TaxID=1982044 RepID=A0A2G1QSX5_9HYPH|nr:hypothetical protein [Zhengella mangrovi]PHP68581.1 hypothetical protein CSC94_00810 [Zhengella mangrovi]
MPEQVRTRLVLCFPGFEPVPVEAHRRRFERESAKAAPHYGATVHVGEAEIERGPVDVGVFGVTAEGDGWRTETTMVVYGLAGLNAMYDERPFATRLLTGLQGYADYILSGAFVRYARVAWRYFVFVIYPLILLALAVLAGGLVAGLVSLFWSGMPAAFGWLVVLAAVIAVFWRAGKRLHLMLFIDDWAFSRDFVRQRNPGVEAKLAHVFADARRRVGASEADEILVAAHSFGVPTAVLALSDLIANVPRARSARLLTAGSSLLKFALHPAGKRFREAVAAIVANDTPWLDVQSLTDPLHCFGSDPARMFSSGAGERQRTARIRFRSQLSPETYKAIRRDIYRVHRQFVYGVEKRSPYSFHMITAGPEDFTDVVEHGGLSETWSFPGREA